MKKDNYYDFSTALMRCHGLYHLVCRGKRRTPKEEYEYYEAILKEEMQKYEDMGERKQGMANGLKKAAKIAGLEYQLKQLESKKHEDPLPATAKSYLKRIYGWLKYGKTSPSKDKGNKYTDKGRLVEVDALTLISKLDGRVYEKNEKRLENEFITGIPDTFYGKSIETAEYIIDVKSSWDWDTFSCNIGDELDPLYWWQIQGYLALTGASQGEVSYCLCNLPETMLNEEKLRFEDKWKKLNDVIDPSIYPEFIKAAAQHELNLIFDDIPEEQRRFKFSVERDDAAINRIYERVPKCRDYLNEFQEKHLMGYFKSSSFEEVVESDDV